MSDIEVEKHYMIRAKETVNHLFDNHLLHPELTRETIDWFEKYIGLLLQQSASSAVTAARLTWNIMHRDGRR